MNFRINRYSAAALRSSLVAVAGALLLASCGGGGSSGSNYRPSRLIAFGDEYSVLVKTSPDPVAIDAKKYSVNGLNADNQPDCYENPLWIQVIAGGFGLVFAECNENLGATTTAYTYARPLATVADVSDQIGTFVGTLAQSDLVAVMVGTNDVINAYEAYKIAALTDEGTARSAALNTVATSGGNLKSLLQGLVNSKNTGARVLYVLIPDVGETPYARAAGNDPALLSALTSAFNDELDSIKQNGRSFGEIYAFDAAPNGAVACSTVPLPNCDAASADEPGAPWANDRFFGPATHSAIGGYALQLISNLPW